jgi:hypothetical protein
MSDSKTDEVPGSGLHGPDKKPGSKGALYDGNFPPGVKPAEAADPGAKTATTDAVDDRTNKADNRS